MSTLTTRRRTGRIAAVLTLALASTGLVAVAAQAATPPTGAVSIKNAGSGKCLDARDYGTTNGTVAQQWDCANGSTAQTWKIMNAGGEYVRIALNNAQSKVVDVRDFSRADGGVVHLWEYGQGENQKWKPIQNGDGSWTFQNRLSGKCLDVPWDRRTTNGVQLQQWACNGGIAQKFWIGGGGGSTTPPTTNPPATGGDLMSNADKKRIALSIMESAEWSTLDIYAGMGQIENIGDGRGLTGGFIGFTSGTGDMRDLVKRYTATKPGNVLAKWIPTLESRVEVKAWPDASANAFIADWKTAAQDPVFQNEQLKYNDSEYLRPAVEAARADGLGFLGQFIYYDAYIMHGEGPVTGPLSESFSAIRAAAMRQAKTPAQNGDERAYLDAFLNVRVQAMEMEAAHDDVARVENAQRVWVREGNLRLDPPLTWVVYGDRYTINR